MALHNSLKRRGLLNTGLLVDHATVRCSVCKYNAKLARRKRKTAGVKFGNFENGDEDWLGEVNEWMSQVMRKSTQIRWIFSHQLLSYYRSDTGGFEWR